MRLILLGGPGAGKGTQAGFIMVFPLPDGWLSPAQLFGYLAFVLGVASFLQKNDHRFKLFMQKYRETAAMPLRCWCAKAVCPFNRSRAAAPVPTPLPSG